MHDGRCGGRGRLRRGRDRLRRRRAASGQQRQGKELEDRRHERWSPRRKHSTRSYCKKRTWFFSFEILRIHHRTRHRSSQRRKHGSTPSRLGDTSRSKPRSLDTRSHDHAAR
ncbi:hypothetical protein LF41_284 [Lysobacter dokdonensis DS-58]|uniref:Uncharacterized protein n=1 Tax=Lysobacter dokdonensis DS-58 TaxID=1300345 RepID=A0A0A2WEX6_9GAMM|nr:hypothetical protein LF41_284 [Lysobacter dokdonensis DS-58]